MSDLTFARLRGERKRWRECHPFGYFARPSRELDGPFNILNWECGIPGMENTPWEGGLYKLELLFGGIYPCTPPICKFVPPIFHPNVFPTGGKLRIYLLEQSEWRVYWSVEDILINVQFIMSYPDLRRPANEEAIILYRDHREEYEKRIRAQAWAMAAYLQ